MAKKCDKSYETVAKFVPHGNRKISQEWIFVKIHNSVEDEDLHAYIVTENSHLSYWDEAILHQGTRQPDSYWGRTGDSPVSSWK